MSELEVAPNACPKCGQVPRVLTTLTGLPYIACLKCGQETKACATSAEAMVLWTAGQYEAKEKGQDAGDAGGGANWGHVVR